MLTYMETGKTLTCVYDAGPSDDSCQLLVAGPKQVQYR